MSRCIVKQTVTQPMASPVTQAPVTVAAIAVTPVTQATAPEATTTQLSDASGLYVLKADSEIV